MTAVGQLGGGGGEKQLTGAVSKFILCRLPVYSLFQLEPGSITGQEINK